MYFRKKGVVVALLVVIAFLAVISLKYGSDMLTGAFIVDQDLSIGTAVTACAPLNDSATTYDLQNNVLTSTSTCFTVRNSSQIIDCHGFMITYGDGSVIGSTAINNTAGFNNITVRNCRINNTCQPACDTSQHMGIFFRNSANGTITNNTIHTLFVNSHGIFLDSSTNNTVSYNNITTADTSNGLRLNGSSSANTFVNNTLGIDQGSPSGYFAIFDASTGRDFLVYNNSLGSITWDIINLTIENNTFPSGAVVMDNYVLGLANTFGLANLNTTAKLEFKALSATQFPNYPTHLFKNGLRCDISGECNITYDSGTGILTANVSSFSNYTVDVTAPNVNITTPTNGANVSTGTQQFRAEVTDNLGLGNNFTFAFSNGTTPFNRTPSNSSGTWTTSLNLLSLVEGYTNFTVFANDSVGNLNSTQSINITVDRSGPIVAFTSHVERQGIWGEQNFRVNATDYFTCVEGKIIFEFFNGTNFFNATSSASKACTLPNQGGRGGQVIGSVIINTTPGNETFIPDGNLTIKIYSNDSLNNMNTSQNITVFVDNRIAPSVTITAPGNNDIIRTGPQNFTARVVDAINVSVVIFQFNNISNPFNRTASNSSGTWNVSSLGLSLFGEGAHGVRIFANDTLNNINNSVFINFTINLTIVPNQGSSSTPGAGTSSTPSGEPSAPSSEAPASRPTTATSTEAARAFQSGEARLSINRVEEGTLGETSGGAAGDGGSYNSEQKYKVTITNNLDKKMLLSAKLVEELQAPLENEENAIKRIKEELLLEGEIDEAALQRELSILKILENIEVLQVYKTKLSHLLPDSWVGAAVAVPIIPTGKHIEANLLKDLLLNADELQNIEVNPGETLEKEVKIRQGLRLERKAPLQIIFSSAGEKVLIRNLDDPEPLVTGTAVDADQNSKKLDFYIIIPPQPGKGRETFTVEMNINAEKAKAASFLKLPFWGSRNIFSDLYGPYNVNMEKGALLAVQYDVSALPEEYEIVGKVYRNGLEEVAENHFEIEIGK